MAVFGGFTGRSIFYSLDLLLAETSVELLSVFSVGLDVGLEDWVGSWVEGSGGCSLF